MPVRHGVEGELLDHQTDIVGKLLCPGVALRESVDLIEKRPKLAGISAKLNEKGRSFRRCRHLRSLVESAAHALVDSFAVRCLLLHNRSFVRAWSGVVSMSEAHGVYAPQGRIDGSNAAAAERELLAMLERSGPSVVIDLSGLDYLSSAGLRVLLVAAKTARASGGKAVLAGPRPAVAEVLRMSGFDKIMGIAANRESALTAIAGG